MDPNTTRFYSSKNFRLFYKHSESSGLEISISKKFFKLAVERNKIKRRIREIFRGDSLHAKGVVIVFSVFKPFAGLSYEAARVEIKNAVSSLLKERCNEY